MDDLQLIENFSQYNTLRGYKTFHPLANVVDLSKSKPIQNARVHLYFEISRDLPGSFTNYFQASHSGDPIHRAGPETILATTVYITWSAC